MLLLLGQVWISLFGFFRQFFFGEGFLVWLHVWSLPHVTAATFFLKAFQRSALILVADSSEVTWCCTSGLCPSAALRKTTAWGQRQTSHLSWISSGRDCSELCLSGQWGGLQLQIQVKRITEVMEGTLKTISFQPPPWTGADVPLFHPVTHLTELREIRELMYFINPFKHF